MSGLVGMIIGFAMATVVAVVFFLYGRRRRGSGRGPEIKIYSAIEEIQSLGELCVFKAFTKEIVTAKEHWFGEIGKKYFGWLASSKKMMMIFEFEIEFRYNLRDPEFEIRQEGGADCITRMPRCAYDIAIKDIHFCDEQRAEVLPWLLPGILKQAFGAGFDEEDRNRLKDEGKEQAKRFAKDIIRSLRPNIEQSARQTMEALAKGFSGGRTSIEFVDAEPKQARVDYASPGRTAADTQQQATG